MGDCVELMDLIDELIIEDYDLTDEGYEDFHELLNEILQLLPSSSTPESRMANNMKDLNGNYY